jgi:hypothetical protein
MDGEEGSNPFPSALLAFATVRTLSENHSNMAGLFSEDTTIEAKIHSSLEWKPPIGAG